MSGFLIVTASSFARYCSVCRSHNTLPYEPKVVMGLSMSLYRRIMVNGSVARDRYGNHGSRHGRAAGVFNTQAALNSFA